MAAGVGAGPCFTTAVESGTTTKLITTKMIGPLTSPPNIHRDLGQRRRPAPPRRRRR